MDDKRQSQRELKRWLEANASVEITSNAFKELKKIFPFNPTQAIMTVAKDKGKDKRSINYFLGENYKETYKMKPKIKNFIEENLSKKDKKDIAINPRDLSKILTKNYNNLKNRFERKFEKLQKMIGADKAKSYLKFNYELRLMDKQTFSKMKNDDKVNTLERTKKEYEKYFKNVKGNRLFFDEYLALERAQSPTENETQLEFDSWKSGVQDEDDLFSLDNFNGYRPFEYGRGLTKQRIRNLLNKYIGTPERNYRDVIFSNHVIKKEFVPPPKKNLNRITNILINRTSPHHAQQNQIKIGNLKIPKSKNKIERIHFDKPNPKSKEKVMRVGKYENKRKPKNQNKVSKRGKK